MTSRLNLRDIWYLCRFSSLYSNIVIQLFSGFCFFSSNIYKLISMVLKSSTSWLYLIILVFIDFIYGMFNKKKISNWNFFFIYTELHHVLWKYQTRGRFGQTVHQNITIIERFKKWMGLNKVIGLYICPPHGSVQL